MVVGIARGCLVHHRDQVRTGESERVIKGSSQSNATKRNSSWSAPGYRIVPVRFATFDLMEIKFQVGELENWPHVNKDADFNLSESPP
jgi:hypothetical protein